MIFDRVDHVLVDGADFSNRPERPVRQVTARPAGNLGKLRGRQFPVIFAVELSQAGDRDMIDIHVQTHADRIGRHEIIDLTGLIHLDLGIAGARAERAENHRRTATLAAHQFGNGINFVDRERDNGAAPRQAGDLAWPDIRQFRQSWPADKFGSRHKHLNQRTDRVGAQKQRLHGTACAKQPVSKNMAAFRIGTHLDFVDG